MWRFCGLTFRWRKGQQQMEALNRLANRSAKGFKVWQRTII
ncbi:conserved hypothetical protein [delta proteobacterium NaphS2]|nr:conserved hypothetical protein [delta proteobacterium NaphS2]